MRYHDDRDLIETGDMIAVRSAENWHARLTQIVTRSPYTHAGTAIWREGDLYVAEVNGGKNHLTAIEHWDDYDVRECPPELDRAKVEASILDWLRRTVNYNFLAFALVGLMELLRIKAFVHWRRDQICDGGVVAMYEGAGWPEHSRVISPRALAAELKFKLAIRPAPMAA
jgi:hypothetical protein